MKEYVLKKEGQTKHFHMDLKVADSGQRLIRGWASTSSEDRDGEVVSPKAIEESLTRFKNNPVILRDHDMRRPVGKMVSGETSDTGFFISAEIAKGTTDADETWALVEQGILKAFSIGFIPKEVNWDDRTPVIQKMDLVEVSIVAIPSNYQSLFSVAKALNLGTDLIEKKTNDALALRFKSFSKELEFFLDLRKAGGMNESMKAAIDVRLRMYDSLDNSESARKYLELMKANEILEQTVKVRDLQIRSLRIES